MRRIICKLTRALSPIGLVRSDDTQRQRRSAAERWAVLESRAFGTKGRIPTRSCIQTYPDKYWATIRKAGRMGGLLRYLTKKKHRKAVGLRN